ncbi:tetratricopeptide repeat protein [Campylobacter lanienae]|uniref:tetratricopeptide repeat protein n=1 Tax=Campylobacter lanienae TaxID=75658 RepID=UPI002A90B950|nr:tetratricopeptide repeat protein [Campylobacter lanienae]MDY5520204.1 tetratricopeptide repeat protein [Campylobacter lanienae]
MTKIIWIVALLFSVVVAKDMFLKKLESSCDGGDMDACFYLGKLYDNGEGVTQNYQKAAELWKKACDGGNPSACGALGTLYEGGKGLRQDYAIAKEYFGKACDLGNQLGCDGYKRLNNR